MNSTQLKQIHGTLKSAGGPCDLKGAFISADGITATCPECGVSVEIPPYPYTQPTTTYQLTAEEAAAVDAIRAHRATEEAQQFMAQHLLDTAASYHRWLRSEGYGSAFSTFCDDYGYQPYDREMSRKPIYDAVSRLITAAQDAALDLTA